MNTVTMWRGLVLASGCAGAVILLVALAATAQSAETDDSRFVVFSVPGAAGGTIALDMNDSGASTGYSIDGNGIAHGFVRNSRGSISSFDGPATPDSGTFPSGINAAGVIVGTYDDSTGVTHGFVRQPNGAIATLDVGTGGETAPWAVNASGAVAGYFLDANDTYHGFVRTGGRTIVLDAPGAASGNFQGTYAYNINSAGVVEGQFEDGSGVFHCFIRYPDGTYLTVDAHDAGTGQYQGTLTGLERSFSDSGLATGEYVDVNSATHGFLRLASGRIVEFDAPGASSGSSTAPSSVNFYGDIVGWSTSVAGTTTGFQRRRNGSVRTINAPGTGNLGTYAVVINDAGSVAGFYFDSSGVSHGFIKRADE